MIEVDSIKPELIEQYQDMYLKNPDSKIFAPLAEGYRRMGLIAEALNVAKKGCAMHPTFSSGRLVMGRILLDLGKTLDATAELKAATDLSPENILAHSLLAEAYLKLREPKNALRSYKMMLFLNPENAKAQTAVKKLESLTADEFDSETFAMKPLKEAIAEWETFDKTLELDGTFDFQQAKPIKDLDRFTSLIDAHTARNEVQKAEAVLEEAFARLGPHFELIKRKNLLSQRRVTTPTLLKPISQVSRTEQKLHVLQDLLARIREKSYE
jgi:tetratricopeptide (TPR) repeat protein